MMRVVEEGAGYDVFMVSSFAVVGGVSSAQFPVRIDAATFPCWLLEKQAATRVFRRQRQLRQGALLSARRPSLTPPVAET